MITLLWILIAFALVFLNAFFVAAEFGMVRLRNSRIDTIQKMHGVQGKILVRIHKNLDSYLSACQFGITLASLGLGWIGEPAFSELLSHVFKFIQVTSQATIEFFSFFLAFSLLSFLHIVVGELMPKSLAIRQSEQVSIWTAVPLYGFYWIMFPAIWVLNACSNFLLKLAKLDKVHTGENFYSTEEIKFILSASHLHGELTKDETEIIKHTLDFADLQIKDIMQPIENMIVLNIDQPIHESLQIINNTQYSRYPIQDETHEKIIGIVHIKDLFMAQYQKNDFISLKQFIRPALKVPSNLLALELLSKFREGQSHFAVVYDTSEKIVGLVTLDNLLHVLLGRIKDEFHKTKEYKTSA